MILRPSLQERMVDARGRPLFRGRSSQRGVLDFYRFAAVGGPDPASRVLALDMEGTTTTYVDNCSNPKTVTANGSASQTTAQFKFDAKSTVFTASASDYLNIAGHADFSMTTFTVQGWVMWDVAPSNSALIELGSYITGFSLRAQVGGNDLYVYWNSGSGTLQGIMSWNADTWQHFAMTRDASNNLRLFGGGTLLATAAGVTQVLSSPTVRIGHILDGGVSSSPQKWIDDFTIANTCWWTSTFTPPASPLAGP